MKTNRIGIASLIFTSLFNGALQAQIDPSNVRDGEKYEYCHTHKKMEKLMQDPGFLQSYLESQNLLQQIEEQLATAEITRGTVYTIPVVFHLLHNNGAERISDSQIYDAFYYLNRDYRKRNPDTIDVVSTFTSRIADIEIEFALATKAPDGTEFNGITHTISTQTNNGEDGWTQVETIANNNDVYVGEWPGNKYLNIFICADIGGAAGYTNKPSNWWGGAAMTNGIWVLSEYVGSIGTGTEGRARTLTHEVGHWLNLDHTWGGNNNPGNAGSCSTDDGVSDTPNTIGVTTCNLNEASCGPVANVENYMDYSYCSKMFTAGQKNKMRAAITSTVGGRSNLWTSTNLTETGSDFIVQVNFDASNSSVCANSGQIQFMDKSYNHIITREWSFPGANIGSSNAMDPIVSYSTPGIYPVLLTVSDGVNTKSLTKYVRVFDNPRVLPILDGFELYADLGSTLEWEVYDQQQNTHFELANGIGSTGSKCVKLDNFSVNGPNVDELISSTYDLSGITSTSAITISFKYSYRKRVSTDNEKLQVLYSDDCGQTWDIRKTLLGNTLSSQTSDVAWVPGAGDFTQVHLTNVTSAYWNNNFRFKFRFEGNGGNNLYIDDINIYASGPSSVLVGTETEPTSGIEEKAAEIGFGIFPNPADEEVQVLFESAGNQETQIQIVDLMGKVVVHEQIQATNGQNLVFVPTSELAGGVYLLNLQMAGKVYTQQLVIR